MEAKPWYSSKTILINWTVALLAVVALVLDAVAADQIHLPVEPDAATTALILSIINVVMRYITSRPIG